MKELTFTQEEAAGLAYIAVERKLKHFAELLDSGTSFNEAVREAFGEEERPNKENNER